MKLEAQEILAQPAKAWWPAQWRVALPLLAASIVAILAIYWPTVASIVAIWERSETFAHGYLIVPITLVLVWTRRRELARLIPTPDVLGFVLLAGLVLGWLAANAGQVLVIEQYAMTAMIPAAVLAIAGRQVALALLFPLAFLFFAVPMGEALIPPLMDWTANFTVAALQLTGIPVYREGLFFTIPSGNWSVVEGCSGLRYLIASVTVGVLFAYLNYRRWWKRALFVALAVAVPILANGMRAYGIVMIAHLSDMKLAMGVDHFIYGWVFFGLVMLLLFWLGSFWRDAPAESESHRRATATSVSVPRAVAAALAVVGLTAAGPLYAAWLDRPNPAAVALPAPAGVSGWLRAEGEFTNWRPKYDGPAASFFEVYRRGERTVVLFVGYYRNQRQDAELINSTNVMVVQKHPVWSNVGEARRKEDLGGSAIELRQTRLRSREQRLLIWDWFWVSGSHFSSPYLGKLYLARDKLLGRGDDGAAIIMAAPYEESAEAAQQTLREFARDMLPALETLLAGVAR
jgi:exosortase A